MENSLGQVRLTLGPRRGAFPAGISGGGRGRGGGEERAGHRGALHFEGPGWDVRVGAELRRNTAWTRLEQLEALGGMVPAETLSGQRESASGLGDLQGATGGRALVVLTLKVQVGASRSGWECRPGYTFRSGIP